MQRLKKETNRFGNRLVDAIISYGDLFYLNNVHIDKQNTVKTFLFTLNFIPKNIEFCECNCTL